MKETGKTGERKAGKCRKMQEMADKELQNTEISRIEVESVLYFLFRKKYIIFKAYYNQSNIKRKVQIYPVIF